MFLRILERAVRPNAHLRATLSRTCCSLSWFQDAILAEITLFDLHLVRLIRILREVWGVVHGLLLFDRLSNNNLRRNLSTLIRLVFRIFISIHLVFFFFFLFNDWDYDLFVFFLFSVRFLVDHRRLHRRLVLKLTILWFALDQGIRGLLFIRGYLRGLFGVGNASSANNFVGLSEFQLFLPLFVFGIAGFRRKSLLQIKIWLGIARPMSLHSLNRCRGNHSRRKLNIRWEGRIFLLNNRLRISDYLLFFF